MPLDTQLSDLAVNVQADALASLLDNGFIDIMTGPKPKDTSEPITTQIVLATLEFGKPAFFKAKAGIITANPIAPGIGEAEGMPRWFRAYRSDHKTVVFDGTAGKGDGFNMSLPAISISAGIVVGCSSLTHTVVKATPGI